MQHAFIASILEGTVEHTNDTKSVAAALISATDAGNTVSFDDIVSTGNGLANAAAAFQQITNILANDPLLDSTILKDALKFGANVVGGVFSNLSLDKIGSTVSSIGDAFSTFFHLAETASKAQTITEVFVSMHSTYNDFNSLATPGLASLSSESLAEYQAFFASATPIPDDVTVPDLIDVVTGASANDIIDARIYVYDTVFSENHPTGTGFTVTLSEVLPHDVTLQYSVYGFTGNGWATEDVDFVSDYVSTITIAAGSLTGFIPVVIINDDLAENAVEKLNLAIFNPTGATLAGGHFNDVRVGYLLDDDFYTTPTSPQTIAEVIAANEGTQPSAPAPTKSGVEFVVNSTTKGEQSEPSITDLADGGFVVTWRDSSYSADDPWNEAIRAQVFNADGSTSGDEFLVNSTTLDSQVNPSVASLADGGFVIAWTDYSGISYNPSGPEAYLNIRAQVFNADGSTSGGEFAVNSTTSSNQSLPSITGLTDGRFFIVWKDGSGAGTRGQVFNADGSTSGDEFTVNSTVGRYTGPLITALADGRFVVSAGEPGDSWAQMFNADGSTSGDEFWVDPATDGRLLFRSASLPDRRYVTTWSDSSSSADGPLTVSIKAQVLNADGSTSGDEFVVSTTTNSYQIEPSITALGDGRIAVTWRDRRFEDIKVQIFDLSEAVELTGSTTEDVNFGSVLDDVMHGNGGDDFLAGQIGNDTLYGGLGKDTLIGDGGDDLLNGGNGRDKVLMGAGNDLYQDNGQTGVNGQDTVNGNQGNDTIEGGGGNDVFYGDLGNDVIRGRLGNDKLYGGDGFDTLDGGEGNDSVTGGNGRDKVLLGAGNDKFFDNGQTGANASDTVNGNQGNDTIEGGGGADVFSGDLGNDVIRGRLGNDKLYGGDGFDTLDGGDGFDSVWGGNGRDKAFLGKGNDIFFDNAQSGVNGQDTVFAGNGNDSINGGAGDDVSYGGNHNDRLIGGGGNDRLYGGANADKLFGGDGNDSLWGGSGIDHLTGGNGLDRFFFADGFGQDTVFGFAADDGEDISLAGVTGITGFTDLVSNHLYNIGGTAQIVDGANSILLNGVAYADVGVGQLYSADDFVF